MPAREEKKRGTKILFKEIIVENFTNLVIYIFRFKKQTSESENTKKSMPNLGSVVKYNILTKFEHIKNKEKQLV